MLGLVLLLVFAIDVVSETPPPPLVVGVFCSVREIRFFPDYVLPTGPCFSFRALLVRSVLFALFLGEPRLILPTALSL